MISKFLATFVVIALACSGSFAAEKKRATMKRSQMAQYEGEYLVDGAKVRKLSGKKSAGSAKKKTTNVARSSSSRKNDSRRVSSRSPASASGRKSARNSISQNKGRPLSKWKNSSRSMAGSVKRLPSKRTASSASKRSKSSRSTASTPSKRKSTKRSSEPKHARKSHPPKRSNAKHASRDDGRLPYVKQTEERDLPFISIPNSRVRRNDKTIVMGEPDTMPEPTRVEPVAPTDVNLERTPAAVAAPTVPVAAPAAVQTVEAPVAGPREPETFDLHSEAAGPTSAR